jgi:hypothetical protein
MFRMIILALLLMIAVPAMAARDATILWDNPITQVPDENGTVEPFNPNTDIDHYLIYVDDVENLLPVGQMSGTDPFFDFQVGPGEHHVEVVVVAKTGEASAKSDPLVFTVPNGEPEKATNVRIIFKTSSGPNG